MRFGLFGINIGPCADPETARRVALAAEQAGLESLWTGEPEDHLGVHEDANPNAPSSLAPRA